MRAIYYKGEEVEDLIKKYKKCREDISYKHTDFLDSLCEWYSKKGFLTEKQFGYLESYCEEDTLTKE